MRKRPGLRAVIAGALALLTCAPAAGARAPEGPPTAERVERQTVRFVDRFGDRTRARPAGRAAATGEPLLPESLALAYYGAPQMPSTVLGRHTPSAAATRLERQIRPYEKLGDRPVTGAFDLVSVLATADRGADRLYRSRQDPEVIETYLEQARASGARLMLDIQPGRSTFVEEVRALRGWIAEPDVDVALDPEWNVGPTGVPGRTVGKVNAREVRAVERRIAAIVETNDLPPKLLVVHQFRRGSVRGRARLAPRDGVQTVLNFDGIGSPEAKRAGYVDLSAPEGLFNGFSLFYRLDDPLIQPASVLALEPEPDFLLYQ